jgi:hypothetical protein
MNYKCVISYSVLGAVLWRERDVYISFIHLLVGFGVLTSDLIPYSLVEIYTNISEERNIIFVVCSGWVLV